ncbi:MAG: type I-E CRISPR-associated protein Cas6/Cse3/CasE [Nostocoides sp.]
MFLSQAAINPRRRGARWLLASPQRMHAAVLGGFAPGQTTTSAEGRLLWRVDQEEHHARLLVVSPEVPDFSGLVEDAGWPLNSPAQSKAYTPFLQRIVTGSTWHYRIRANPVKRVSQPDRRPSRVVPQVTAEHQAQWWLEKSAAIGLRVLDGPALVEPRRAADTVAVSHRGTATFSRRDGDSDGRARVTLVTATFEGMAEVTDADAVRAALTCGVGRAKGYGCGLLTLVSPRV